MSILGVVILGLLAYFFPNAANAEAGGNGDGGRLRLELGADASLGIGSICEEASDLKACSPGQGAAGFSLHAGWLLRQGLSLGFLAAYQWAPNDQKEGSESVVRTVFHESISWLAAEGQWTPWTRASYMTVNLGVVRYRQRYSPLSNQRPKDVLDQWAPAAGVGVGWFLLQSARFTIAVDLRGWITAFESSARVMSNGQTGKQFGVLPWFSLGIHLGIRP